MNPFHSFLRSIRSTTSLVLCVLGTALFAQPTYQVVPLGNYAWNDAGTVTAGIPTEQVLFRVAPETAGRQRQQNWCWAACAQMCLNYFGIPITQEDIVMQRFGSLLDLPGDRHMMLDALAGQYTGTDGRCIHMLAMPLDLIALLQNSPAARTRPWSFAETILFELSHGQPVLVSMDVPGQDIGHAVLLTSMTFEWDPYGQMIPRTITFRDPWPYAGSKQVMTFYELASRIRPSASFILRPDRCGAIYTVGR